MFTLEQLTQQFPNSNKSQLERVCRLFRYVKSTPELEGLPRPIIGYDESELSIYVVWYSEDMYALDISFYDNGRCEWYFSNVSKDIDGHTSKECDDLYFKEDGCLFYLGKFVKKA
jgi:hypothetical protein